MYGATRLPPDDLAAAGRLVGSAQQIRSAVTPWFAGGNADTDCAGEQFTVDRHLLVQVTLQPLSKRFGGLELHWRGRHDDEFVAAEPGDRRRHVNGFEQQLDKRFDESVAGVVTEVVVDHLEPVQIEQQCRDRTRLAENQSFVEMGDQRPAVQQIGQVVVLGEIQQPILGDDAGLQLCQQRCNRLERVHLCRQPFPVADLDEAQNAGGDVPGQQRHAREGGLRNGRSPPRRAVDSPR